MIGDDNHEGVIHNVMIGDDNHDGDDDLIVMRGSCSLLCHTDMFCQTMLGCLLVLTMRAVPLCSSGFHCVPVYHFHILILKVFGLNQ